MVKKMLCSMLCFSVHRAHYNSLVRLTIEYDCPKRCSEN